MSFPPACSAQVVARLYYNKDWILTKKDSVVYFRVAILDTANQVFAGEVKDYTKNAKLLMTGYYTGGVRNGVFTSYYPSGQKESEGSYVDDKRAGAWRFYYENGGLQYEAAFNEKSADVLEARDSSGNILLKDGTGTWIGTHVEYSTQLRMTVRGEFKDHQPAGIWTQTTPDGNVVAEEAYQSGVFKRGYLVLEDNTRIELHSPYIGILHEPIKHRSTTAFAYVKGTTSSDYPYIKRLQKNEDYDWVFAVVEMSAFPKGGMAKFYQTIGSLIQYPKDARRMGIEGKVFVEFIVEKDGSFTEVKVIKGIGAGCDEEAVRVVLESQKKLKWTPGVQGRRAVRQRYTMPIQFRLG